MKSTTARLLSLIALAVMGLAACAPLASSPEAETPDRPTETVGPTESAGPAEPATPETEIELIGAIESMSPAAWTMNGKVLAILPETEFKGTFLVGDMVKVHATVRADGSLAAREIEPLLGAGAVELTEIGAEYDFTGAVDAIALDQWTVAGTTFAVTSQTEIKGTFAIGDLVKVHVLVEADGSLAARAIEAPEAELERSGEGVEVELVALIKSISTDAWVIGGQTLSITPETEIKGTFAVGDAVKVHVLIGPGGTLVAREIEAADVGEVGEAADDNTNANSNENENGNSNTNEDVSGNDNGHGNGSGGGNDNGGGNGNSNSSGGGSDY